MPVSPGRKRGTGWRGMRASRPSRSALPHEFLAARGLTVAEHAHCIVGAGQTVLGFSRTGGAQAEFLVHSPFA
jgi:hypothetical protein